METTAQQKLFQYIKDALPPHISLADEISEQLNISIDSAYRRIRGEKSVSLDELQKLASHYRISLDQLLHIQSDAFLFHGRITNNTDFNFNNWLQQVIQHLAAITSAQPNHLFYLAKEIPFMYYFMIPEIASFKSYFFMRSILYYDDWKNKVFSLKDDYSQYYPAFKKISDLFASIPSTEIWSIENITSTLHQIEYYRVTGALSSDEDACILLDKLEDMVSHIEKQAEAGRKFRYGSEPVNNDPLHKMYVNELIMGDNMQLVQIGNVELTYINHSVINFIVTRDAAFNSYMKRTMDVIAQKSTPISEANEKERLLFFNRLRAKIKAARQLIVA